MNTEPKIVSPRDIPSGAFQEFPLNCWYVAAGSSELGEALLSRKLLGRQVVMYRTKDGEPVAMQDWCPHRGYPLSLGTRLGDNIQCGYHGITFDRHGQCVRVPSQQHVPRAMRTPTFPVVEKWLWVWIWMGDPEKADPALIPTTGYEDRPGNYENFYLCCPMKGNAQLLHDNLLDGTHVSFLHPGSIDNDGESNIAETPIKLEVGTDYIRQTRDVYNVRPAGDVCKLYGVGEGQLLHRNLVTVTHVPSIMLAATRMYDMNNPHHLVAEQIVVLPVTPASATECYHFAGMSTSFPSGDPDHVAMVAAVVAQDLVAIEAGQRFAEETGGMEISVRADEAAIRCRRMIAAMVQEERAEATS